MSKCVFVVVCLVGVAFANHGHHGHQHGHGHHHGHEEAAEEQPQVQAAAAEGNVATTFPGGSFFQVKIKQMVIFLVTQNLREKNVKRNIRLRLYC